MNYHPKVFANNLFIVQQLSTVICLGLRLGNLRVDTRMITTCQDAHTERSTYKRIEESNPDTPQEKLFIILMMNEEFQG